MCLGNEFRYYRVDEAERRRLLSVIREKLSEFEDVLLAIVFGSFIELSEFRDIDVAVYMLDPSLERVLQLSAELEEALGIPVDVVPLSEVSPRFRLYILTKGEIVLERVAGLYEALLSMTLDDIEREEIVP